MRSYLSFIAANPWFLAFGFLAAFFSSFGQTFFIAMFGGELRAAFDLSHTAYGALYSGATLASGLTLTAFGRLMDRMSLERYTLAVCVAAAAACVLMGLTPSAVWLVVAFFTLRLTGQGLLSHLSSTAMGRGFTTARGKAVSLAALGHPAGEAVLPALAVVMIGALGWRGSWLAMGTVLLVGLPALMLWLLRRGRPEGEKRAAREASATARERDRSLGGVARDPLFTALALCVLVTPVVITGMFFHQVALMDAKGWSLSWLATCYVAFAATTTLSGLMAGSLVDRLGTRRVLPGYLLPLAAGLAIVAVGEARWVLPLYLALAGVTAGASFTVLGALWAEVYGTAHLGAIRGLVQTLVVLGSAVAPVLVGWLLDAGLGFPGVALIFAAYAMGAAALLAGLQPALRTRTAA
ncbi:Sugar phosphate permease [Limimonas halophila]|uniref:Sugar phosphate permease n=1 Tax=Limimonas halophila TaxID=1082479 RepID=A0A1G7M760_9PROT|nr:MFS transporter [Limimonas halophila]SDF57648.1 Sugar phosphate permease [Limimonas halophila]